MYHRHTHLSQLSPHQSGSDGTPYFTVGDPRDLFLLLSHSGQTMKGPPPEGTTGRWGDRGQWDSGDLKERREGLDG